SRLLERTARELVTGNPRGKAEVVLDARRGAGLTSGRLALDDKRAQPLRCAVHRGRKSGRARADHDRVVLRTARLGSEPQQLRDATEAGAHDRLPVGEADRGTVTRVRKRLSPLSNRLVRLGL